jgi:hypothetical protein
VIRTSYVKYICFEKASKKTLKNCNILENEGRVEERSRLGSGDGSDSSKELATEEEREKVRGYLTLICIWVGPKGPTFLKSSSVKF